MKLKGDWSADNTYNVGDVARYTDGNFYKLLYPCNAGTGCMDVRYWNRIDQTLAECAEMIMNGMEITEGKIPSNISDEALSLKTDDSEYLVTVDDSGDTPELVVTEVEGGDA